MRRLEEEASPPPPLQPDEQEPDAVESYGQLACLHIIASLQASLDKALRLAGTQREETVRHRRESKRLRAELTVLREEKDNLVLAQEKKLGQLREDLARARGELGSVRKELAQMKQERDATWSRRLLSALRRKRATTSGQRQK